MGPSAAHLCCTNFHIWGVAPGVLLHADLPEEPGCLPPCGPSQNHHQKSCSSQPGVTGDPSNGNLGRICQWSLEKLDPG